MTVLNMPAGALCRSVFPNGHISARSMPVASFAMQPGRVLRQLVVDRRAWKVNTIAGSAVRSSAPVPGVDSAYHG
jgi:hypothetical protein